MPELPEVERGRMLAAAVAEGRIIKSVETDQDEIVFGEKGPLAFRRAVSGKKVKAVRRWGKQLWFELETGPHPLFHFGMSGGFRVQGDTPLQLKSGPTETGEWPPRFAKVRLVFADRGELVMTDARRLGRILLRDHPEGEPPLSKLGFDPFLAMPTRERFAQMLASRGGVIKSVLLDQSFAAGVGNWIADEVLFQAGIDPRRRAKELDPAQVSSLHRKLRHVVRAAVNAISQGREYPKAWLFHRRWGKQSHATTAKGDPIEHLSIGGRTTAWVPATQR